MRSHLLATYVFTSLVISLTFGDTDLNTADDDIKLKRLSRDLGTDENVVDGYFEDDEDHQMEKKWGDRSRYRTFDSLASSLVKKKRYYDGRNFDSLASGLVGKRYGDGRNFDTLASGLIGKRYGDGYFDTLASGLVGKRRPFDSLASSLIKRYDGRTFDDLASGLIGKRNWQDKRYRYFDSLASTLVGKRTDDTNEDDEFDNDTDAGMPEKRGYFGRWGSRYFKRRPFDSLASSLIRR